MRTTNDKKDYNLRIRLNDRMYSHLQKMSDKHEMSFSGYVRHLIDKDISDGNICNNHSDINSVDTG